METRRLQKEAEELQKLNVSGDNFGVTAHMVGNAMTHWKGILRGPVNPIQSDTVYQGGTFFIDITIPPDYPYKPPRMKFDTKIWHPNVSSQTGVICLDILKDEWSPALTIRTALLSLQALMCSPEPDDPQDGVVATQYKNNKNEFDQTAREWTRQYAKDPEDVYREKVQRLAEMGFDEATARNALEQVGWDESAALNSLLG